MIGCIHGTILKKKAPTLLLDVQGVGYEIHCPMTSFYELPAEGQSITLHTHLQVREDAWNLFGFGHAQQRDLFRLLIKVNGIGAKVALSLLSGMTTQQLLQCLSQERIAELVQIPGIGKKTAERLVLETRNKLEKWDIDTDGENTSACNTQDDAISALEALGYKKTEAKKVLAKLPKEIETVEEKIRLSLQHLVKGAAHV